MGPWEDAETTNRESPAGRNIHETHKVRKCKRCGSVLARCKMAIGDFDFKEQLIDG